MGLIFDLDYPATVPVCRAVASERRPAAPLRVRERKRRPRIEVETPIVPGAVARSVWAEASVWLGEALPPEWGRRLAVRANVIYARNARYRRRIRGRGDNGRDYLWIFTRHWLAAMIRRHRPEWYARLPETYSVGGGLPAGRSAASPLRRQRNQK